MATYLFDIHLNGSFDLFVIASGEFIAFVFRHGVGGTGGDSVADGVLQREEKNNNALMRLTNILHTLTCTLICHC